MRVNKSLLIGRKLKKYFSGFGGALGTVIDYLRDHDAYRLEYSDGHVDVIPFNDILKLLPKSWSKREGRNEVEFPRCFRTLVVKIEKTNSNSTRDFSKRINFTRVDLFFWSTLVVKIKKRRNPLRAHIRRT